MRVLRIGTRGSLLALAQTKIIADTISDSWPDVKIEIVKITTTGDKNMSPFSSDPSGIKGMFTREIEQALLKHDIDIAVHSLKDLPANMNPELPIVAYSHRGDPRDALVMSKMESEIATIGTSSIRRRLQAAKFYPEVKILPLRGNIDTRLKKLDSGKYSALIMSAAGLQRLGLAHRITRIFSPEEIMPAPGQGILACQGRIGGEYDYLECVNDSESKDSALAERTFSRALNAACNVPIGAYAEIDGETLTLKGLYVREATREFLRGEISGKRSDAEKLGQNLAEVIMS